MGTILESIALSWSGTGGQISNDSITNLTSNGVSCEVNDIFGNNISSNVNVTFDSSILGLLALFWQIIANTA